MNEQLVRVGTTYLPVSNVEKSLQWYVEKLGAALSYKDEEKAIVNMAGQSFFLVSAKYGETSNFTDAKGRCRFAFTFEVDGEEALQNIRNQFIENRVQVGEIEDRGHKGRNFVFYDLNGNQFDVWSVLSKDV
ncbi:VOC family protein [Halobacillus sp. A5]|uniref:VOC family protein n=1 Tax=Halobacillus sp. A5 TaxID=2880263 RepID=UPI0020A6D224|nr:VOC family protein [Halobacillus sp. A5]MCP3028903.1 VOC family protein [Halobacillus sp. A5]